MTAGVKAGQPPMAPPQGPLSYLSTVTTAGSSDWGSQALDTLAQQPSESARRPSNTVTGPPPDAVIMPPDAVRCASDAVTSATPATASGPTAVPLQSAQGPDETARASEAQGSDVSRKVSAKKQSLADRLLRKTGSGNRHSSSSSRNSAVSEASAPASTATKDLYSKTQPSAASVPAVHVNDASRNAGGPALLAEQAPQLTWSSDMSTHGQNQSWQPGVAKPPQNQTEAADWDAFEGSSTASAAQEPQHATASQTTSGQQSGHDWSAAGVSQATGVNDDWSAFVDPANDSFDAAPSGLNDSIQEAAVPAEPAADHSTNPFLDPGQDPWQNNDQAASAESADIARMASADSFGDFNAPGEPDIEFGHAAWCDPPASAQDMKDWAAAAAAAPADPFAASTSYNDFAALLEPAHTELVENLDATGSAEPTSLQRPPNGQFDLSELQGNLSHSLQYEIQGAGQAASQSSGTSLELCRIILADVPSVGCNIHVARTAMPLRNVKLEQRICCMYYSEFKLL